MEKYFIVRRRNPLKIGLMKYIKRKPNKSSMSHTYRHAWLSLIEQKQLKFLRYTQLRIVKELQLIKSVQPLNSMFHLLLSTDNSCIISQDYLKLINKEEELVSMLYKIEAQLKNIYYKYVVEESKARFEARTINSFTEKECVNYFRFRREDLKILCISMQ